VVADLVADQVGRGWRVVVACPDGPLADEVLTCGGAHVRWDARRPVRTFPGEARSLRPIVASVRPDVVHLHSAKPGLVGRLVVRGSVPTIYEPHGWPFTLGSRTDVGARCWERAAAGWTDVLLCVSESEAERGRAVGIRSTTVVVPNGVDLDRFPTHDDGQARAAARLRLALPTGPLAVCVGRVCRQKAQDVVLDAWPRVARAVPGAMLAIVGDGPDRAALAARAVPGVQFVGQRSDVVDWLTAADVVVQPSRWEGMAVTVLEAMASRRSLVVTDADGMVEAVGEGGERAGAMVPIDDPEALAARVAERLSDPLLAAREGAVGRSRVEARFDRRRVAESVASVVTSLVRK
jgi:glycosyltransferase involved in cell wall biosynthesis